MRNPAGAILRELLGLFVDDGRLALEIVAVIAVAALLAQFDAPAAGLVLLAGCPAVLSANVRRASRRAMP
jgi:hypothetical protein